MKKYQMKLGGTSFEQVREGAKVLELRLFDKKRRKIEVGDKITFSNKKQKLTVAVVGLSRFANFFDLFDSLGGVSAGWLELDTSEKMAKDMRRCYSEEKEKKYGVLGIHIKLD